MVGEGCQWMQRDDAQGYLGLRMYEWFKDRSFTLCWCCNKIKQNGPCWFFGNEIKTFHLSEK